jgi:hypothetical protein
MVNQKSAQNSALAKYVASEKVDDHLLEMVFQKTTATTFFAVAKDGIWRLEKEFVTRNGERLIPYTARNNLIANDVILLPSQPEEYGSEERLLAEIQAYLHRYIDVSPLFEKIASYYVLLSWLYDTFNELPYIRFRGQYGSGKTRSILVVGSICYRPIFASGASSVSPIFHILDKFGGTLVLDEGDFRFSDEKADIVKILNSGNVKGVPVLRNELLPTKEYNPRAFQVFGPKIVSTRGCYDDRALESRFITEVMGTRPLRSDIPINLSSVYKNEALHLRNKLLLYRVRNYSKSYELDDVSTLSIEPRLLQIMRPLLSMVNDGETKNELCNLIREYQMDTVLERSADIEALVLTAIKEVKDREPSQPLTVKAITEAYCKNLDNVQERFISTKRIGAVVRRQLHLRTQKSHGVFIIPPSEYTKLTHLYTKYGISP